MRRAFQQAKDPHGDRDSLQIVAEQDARATGATKGKVEPRLTRVAFRVSRLMEFCTLRELQNQTGHSWHQWLLVILKELVDNALDAAEEADIAPVVSITVGADGSISVADNGSGIETATIQSILDYTVRVSSREAYVSPTRGAQGNALKTVLAMGYVLAREIEKKPDSEPVGVTIIETRGLRHLIEFRTDHINNQPKITHQTGDSSVKIGSKITVKWPAIEWWDSLAYQFKSLAESYVWLNPHLTLRATWHRSLFIDVTATDPNWKKWKPYNPTSAHWYDEARLQRYMAAHVARGRERGEQKTVREFISEFRGLSGTAVQRKVLEEVGCSHQSLAQFFGVKQVNRIGIAKLLASMRKHSKPVAPNHLGLIGRDHLQHRFLAAGGNADTFKYEKRLGATSEGIPYIVEFAFGLHQSGLTQDGNSGIIARKFITGANWSVGIENPFRAFGSTGEGLESTLAKVRANASQPVICVLHLASAYVQYADRGKSSIILTDDASQPDD